MWCYCSSMIYIYNKSSLNQLRDSKYARLAIHARYVLLLSCAAARHLAVCADSFLYAVKRGRWTEIQRSFQRDSWMRQVMIFFLFNFHMKNLLHYQDIKENKNSSPYCDKTNIFHFYSYVFDVEMSRLKWSFIFV